MINNELSITPEDFGTFFQPILEAYIPKVEAALSQSKGNDLSDSEWKIISNSGQMGEFGREHTIVESCEQFDLFFKRDSKLYAFIEEKKSGLVESDYTVWSFFSANAANSYFNHLLEKPKNFNTKAIIALPFITLLDPLKEKLDIFLADKTSSAMNQIAKTNEIIELGERYLDQAEFVVFDSHIKKAISGFSLEETKRLMKEIKNPNASRTLVEKRLKGLFKISWRYFRAKNELESRYFKKLLTDNPYEQEKGLKLALKKITDFQVQ